MLHYFSEEECGALLADYRVARIGKQKGLLSPASELMVDKVRERILSVQCKKEKGVGL